MSNKLCLPHFSNLGFKKPLSVIILFPLIFALSCQKHNQEPEANANYFFFKDGFETTNNLLDDLFPNNNARWTTIQRTNPTNESNEISINKEDYSEGISSLRLLAYRSDSLLSKINIEKNGLEIKKGDQVSIKADFFINTIDTIENLLLIDLECCSCWDPLVGSNYGAENQCPGIRLMMSGGNDFLSIERGKISGSTLQQTSLSFPRKQWVSIQWEMTMSNKEDGLNKLIINGEEVINKNGMNMPDAHLFKEAFASEGIDFILTEPTIYERVQIGVTANPTAGDVEIFVDNFSIEVN